MARDQPPLPSPQDDGVAEAVGVCILPVLVTLDSVEPSIGGAPTAWGQIKALEGNVEHACTVDQDFAVRYWTVPENVNA